jgi:hypothetical protein
VESRCEGHRVDESRSTAEAQDGLRAAEAQDGLRAAEAAAGRVRESARWMSTYLGVFAVAWPLLTFAIGMGSRTQRAYAMIIVWPAIVVGVVLWSRRRPATLRGADRRMLPFWGATAAVYGVVLAVGLPGQQGNLEYWIPASLAVGVPLVLAAWRESRA